MEDVTTKIGNLLLRGWTMLGESCDKCRETPLMRSRDKRLYCAKCDIYSGEQPKAETLVTETELPQGVLQSKLKAVREIPMSDDSIHKPDWNPESYLKEERKVDSIQIAEKALESTLGRYIQALKQVENSPIDLDRESRILSLINQALSCLGSLKLLR